MPRESLSMCTYGLLMMPESIIATTRKSDYDDTAFLCLLKAYRSARKVYYGNRTPSHDTRTPYYNVRKHCDYDPKHL